MKMPVRYSRKRLRYVGRVPRHAFQEWTASDDGRAVLEMRASRVRFALFGRMRVARRQLLRQLGKAARSHAVRTVLQQEVDAYLHRLDTLVFADGYPVVGVELRRLVVVPRLLVSSQAIQRIDQALQAHPVFSAVEGGHRIRRWFVELMVRSIEDAVVRARPSTRRPLPAGDGWIVVGADAQCEWQIPFDGPACHGHYFVLELTRKPITRAVRSGAGAAIAQLSGAVSALSYVERTEIVSRAARSVEQLIARHKSPALLRSA